MTLGLCDSMTLIFYYSIDYSITRLFYYSITLLLYYSTTPLLLLCYAVTLVL